MRLPRPLFLLLRTLLYLLLGLVFIRGAATFLDRAPQAEAAQQPEATKPATPDPPGLQTIPALFIAEYLTWESTNPAERAARLAPYLAPGLDPQAGWRPPSTPNHQTVRDAWLLETRPDGPGRYLATVAARVELTGLGPEPPQSRTLYLSVPLAQTESGRLAVSGLPALVPTPPAPTALALAPAAAAAKDERAGPLLNAFFTAYFGGGDTQYFLAREALLPASPTGFTLSTIGPAELQTAEGHLRAELPVTVLDSLSGATFTFRYSLRLTEQEGRLYILDLLQKGA